jgi:hypothetical protein
MPVRIFFCYAHEDETLLTKLKSHLSPLKRNGLIDVWYDRDISAGIEWQQEIEKHLNTAQIILLLVSPDFIDSDYCYGIEMKRAIERHEHGEARVIPVIFRPTLWHETPLGKLQALPKDARPVTSWPNLDDALHSIAENIFNIVIELRKAQEEQVIPKPSPLSPALPIEPSKPEPTETAANVRKQQTRKSEPLVTPEDFSWHCIRTLKGHKDSIWSVAISPDGQTLASGSDDGTIKLWKKK